MRTNKIICDTNIWYYVENGTIKLEDYEFKYPLYSTYLSLNELFTTPLWIDNPELVFRVIDSMFANSNLILMFPDDYIWGICLGIDINYNQLIDVEIKADIEFYKKAKVDFHSSLQAKPIFDAWIDNVNNFNLEQKKRADKVKEVEKEMKEISLEINYKKMIYKDENAIKEKLNSQIEEKFYSIFNKLDSSNYINILSEFKKQFELFNHTTFQVMKLLTITKFAHQENDFEDLDNLIYVNESDLYWTEEKRWINLVKDSKMNKYLEIPKLNKKNH